MSIGKDSIQKRVAKTNAPAEEATQAPQATEVKEAKPTVKKAPAKKSTTGTAKAPAAKKPAAKKATAPKADAPAAPTVGTAVMANVSPEVVEKITGHKENSAVEHVQIGAKMPSYLL